MKIQLNTKVFFLNQSVVEEFHAILKPFWSFSIFSDAPSSVKLSQRPQSEVVVTSCLSGPRFASIGAHTSQLGSFGYVPVVSLTELWALEAILMEQEETLGTWSPNPWVKTFCTVLSWSHDPRRPWKFLAWMPLSIVAKIRWDRWEGCVSSGVE